MKQKNNAVTQEQLRFATVAVDVVVFAMLEGGLQVLLTTIHRPPHYKGARGFIGGLIDIKEDADEAVTRHLKDKARLTSIYTEQLYTFSKKKRDPRSRVISVGHIGLLSPEAATAHPVDGMFWMPVEKVKALAFDHDEISQTF